LLPTIVAQVGNQGRGQGSGRNQNGDTVNDHIRGDVGNATKGNDRRGCTYEGKGASKQPSRECTTNSEIRTRGREAAVSISWEDFRTLTKEEFCPSIKMQKLETELWNHAMVGAGHAAYTDRFHELARLVPHLVTPKIRMIERYVYGLLHKSVGWWQQRSQRQCKRLCIFLVH
ncbi:putative reverse transcriptase domain-containing protein, partial [Tanacetum coccineum]